MLDEETYRLHRVIIYSIVLVFQIFGIFGNVNLIILTLRKKSLQSKYGLILMLLATFHLLCLLFEFIDMSYGIRMSFLGMRVSRSQCFYALFPYIFCHSMQTGTICVLSFDLLLTIVCPIRSRTMPVTPYLLVVFVLPVCYSLGTVIAGFLMVDDESIQMCNPPSALHPQVNAVWYMIMMIFSLLTILFYVIAFGILYLKVCRKSRDIRHIEQKALKTLKVLIVAFIIFRFITVALFNVLNWLGVDKDVVILVQNYNIVAGIVAYSQNAYVCYFRSEEYRTLLRQQWLLCLRRLCRVKVDIDDIEGSKVTPSRMQSTKVFRLK